MCSNSLKTLTKIYTENRELQRICELCNSIPGSMADGIMSDL
jgi:hypothetical protein